MTKTWVVVADEAIARILCWSDGGDQLDSVDEITDAAAHADDAKLRRDAYGRRSGGTAPGAPQGSPRGPSSITSSAGEDAQHLEAEGFAQRVAEHLSDAHHARRFDALQLVAAPRFLGLLRKALDPQLSKIVTHELDKDFVHFDNRDISQRLAAEAPSHAERGNA